MTKQEFKNRARSRDFLELPMELRLSEAWLFYKQSNEQSNERRQLLQMIRSHSTTEIVNSPELHQQVFQLFPEIREVTLDIELIAKKLAEYDDPATPLSIS